MTPWIVIIILLISAAITSLGIFFPKFFLNLQDLFRLKGERVYSDLGIILMRISSIVATLGLVIVAVVIYVAMYA